jgi:hypothetical protein
MEPAFLRLYLVEENLPFRCFEDAFWALPADSERPEADREGAWNVLVEWTRPERAPVGWFRAVLRELRSSATYREHARDLARFWTLGDLFEVDPPPGTATTDEPPYYEIHCHLRGAVPFLALWRGWLDNERWRAELRRFECRAGTWRRTWAELVRQAAELRVLCPTWVPHMDETLFLGTLVQRMLHSEETHAPAVRYLAICTALSGFLLHQRGKTGLSAFVVAYDRYSKVQKVRGGSGRNHMRTLVATVLRRFEEEGAEAVELRPTLERRRADLQRKLEDVVLGYFDYILRRPAAIGREQARRPVVMGLVPSLFKQEALRKGEPGDPVFWEHQSRVWEEQVRTLLATLDDVPALRWFVVGLDAAGKERGCPPRALRSAFDLVRRYNEGRAAASPGRLISVSFLRNLAQRGAPEALDELNGKRHMVPIRLGITVHAGEDFEDPLTGLRHIWEAACDLDLATGDRIGHALAAGLDRTRLTRLLERRAGAPGGEVERPDRKQLRFRVRKPRGTHLLDLAWEWRVGGAEERRDAEQRLAAISARAFGAPINAAMLMRDLGRPEPLVQAALPAVRFGDPATVGADDREWVEIDETWLAVFERLRKRVLRELVRRHVVVESCPTSNLAVANLEEPPLKVLAEEDDLRLAIATDDPGLLGCWPQRELGPFAKLRRRLLEENRRASFLRLID